MPELPPEQPPGMPQNAWDVDALKSQARDVLDDCGSTVERLVGQIRGIVDDCLRECDGKWVNCESCISGQINERLVRAGAVGAKCVGKLVDRAAILFNQAEALASPVIGQFPELRDIVAAQMMGVAPTSRAPLPGPPPQGGGQGDCIDPNGQPMPCPPPPVPPPWVPPPIDPPPGGPPPPPYCPPSSYAVFDEATQTWFCKPIMPPPLPKPGPTCDVTPPPCPEGFESVVDPVTGVWICKPLEAPCPPPTSQCPAGQEWWWNGSTWQCRNKPTPGPGPGPGDQCGSTLPPSEPDFMDFLGMSDWNQLFCPDKSLPHDPPTIDQIIEHWRKFVKYALRASLLQCGAGGVLNIGGVIGDFVKWLLELLERIIAEIGEVIIRWLLKNRKCDYLLMAGPIILKAILSLVEHYTNVGFDDLITNLNYSINRECPTYIPAQPGVDRAYLGDLINLETWKCWTRANNNLEVPHEAVMRTLRAQPNHEQWIAAFLRGIINDAELTKRLRTVGVIDEAEKEVFIKLAKYIPGPSDIIRFMLRDVEDKTIVDKYELDAEFPDKYRGLLKDMATAQGVDEATMKRYWRAHWDWPAPGQLYTMLHRLRSDSLIQRNREIAVKLEDILQVLGVKDVIPVWRERLTAISYRLPRKTDAYKLFKFDQWNKIDLVDYYQNYGYPKQTAERMVEIDAQRKVDEKNKAAQLVTKANTSKALIDGAIGQNEARIGFEMAGLKGDQVNIAMEHALFLRAIAQRKRLKSAVKCQFVTCGLNKDQAVAALITAGWDASDAIYEVTCWKQQCDLKGKEASTAQLCDWYGLGFLSDVEYLSRLRKMGWSTGDAERIIGKCQSDLRKKREKEGKGGKGNGNPE